MAKAFFVKSVAHGANTVADTALVEFEHMHELVADHGDDKVLPDMTELGPGTRIVRVTMKDRAHGIAEGDKANFTGVENLAGGGVRTHTWANALCLGSSGSMVRAKDAAEANGETFFFACRSTDGTTDPYSFA